MIVIWIAISCASEYFNLLKEGMLVRPDPPERCVSEDCNRKFCYWRHGAYERTVIDGELDDFIKIERFKCKFCGRTITMLPAFLVPKKLHALRVIAKKCESYATKKDTSYRREANGPDSPASSPSQIWRWVDSLSEKCGSLLLDVQAECVMAGVADELLEMADDAECPNAKKARTEEKKNRLDDLAKFLSFGSVLFGMKKGILSAFGSQRLENVEMLQQIVAGKATIFATPQTVAPQVS
jgi:hypothetical protein